MYESFVYQSLVEMAVFLFGVACGIRTGILSPASSVGRRRLLLLVAGFLFVFALQGAFLVWGK